MTTKHTPTPWRSTENAYGCFHIMHGEGRSSSVVAGGNDHNTLSGEDAAHIVKCVNMHDELVDRMENLLIAIGMGWDLDGVTDAASETLKKAGAL